ncbi:MAG: hypothetical protein WAT19_08725 [Ferruginibacter sp.]
MSELSEHIKLISAKLQQLLKRHELLQKENAAFRQDMGTLRKENEQYRQQLEELKQQQLILKASAAPLNEADKKEMELKINAYLRNIDKCISLLGK